MQCFEFEIICRWVAARLRRRGLKIVDGDPSFMEVVSDLGLTSVADAVSMGEEKLTSVAERLGYTKQEAA